MDLAALATIVSIVIAVSVPAYRAMFRLGSRLGSAERDVKDLRGALTKIEVAITNAAEDLKEYSTALTKLETWKDSIPKSEETERLKTEKAFLEEEKERAALADKVNTNTRHIGNLTASYDKLHKASQAQTAMLQDMTRDQAVAAARTYDSAPRYPLVPLVVDDERG